MLKGQMKAQGSGVAGAAVAVLAVALNDYSPFSSEMQLALTALAGYVVPWAAAYYLKND